MMLITDVIKVMGQAPLGEFPWGCTVRDTVNLFVDKTHALTDKSTGVDIQKAVDSLPEDVRELVLRAKLDPSRHCIASPIGGGMVIEHVETGEPTLDDPKEELKKALMSPLVITTLVVVVGVLLLSLFLVSGLSANKDFDWHGFIKAVKEVFGVPLG